MKIHGIKRLTHEQMNRELGQGARFVIFDYAVSPLLRTYHRSSDVYFIPAGKSTAPLAALFGALSLLAGVWCLPYGPAAVLDCLMVNARGGTDVTEELLAMVGDAAEHGLSEAEAAPASDAPGAQAASIAACES